MAMTAEERRAYQREWSRRWREKHPEKALASQRRTEEKRRGKKRQYSEAALVKRRAGCREWRLNNVERDRALKKRSSLKRNYGITLEQYEEMLTAQGGVCAVCQEPEGRNGKQLCVDHCHDTGVVRSLLCSRCNVCIGQMEERPDLLLAATAYLAKHKPITP